MTRPCPREILERLAKAACAFETALPGRRNKKEEDEYKAALAAYRSATAPLRTLAEVDSEIAECVREEFNVRAPGGYQHIDWTRVVELCCEQTSGPSGVDVSASSPRAEPATGATLSAVAALPDLWESQAAQYPRTTEGAYGAAGVRCCARELREALASGPGSASTTKESLDTAGAPAGAATDPADERDCNCDQAVELARVVKECRRLAQEIVVATEGAG